MTTSKSSDGAGPGLVETMLGVPPGYPSWCIAHMAGQGRVPATWLSSLVARGLPISPQACYACPVTPIWSRRTNRACGRVCLTCGIEMGPSRRA
jgi:hypothetical protein